VFVPTGVHLLGGCGGLGVWGGGWVLWIPPVQGILCVVFLLGAFGLGGFAGDGMGNHNPPCSPVLTPPSEGGWRCRWCFSACKWDARCVFFSVVV